MLIDPDFLDHWRTRALVDALDGDELAPLYLIRLWAHCQTRKSDTFEIPTAGLKALCRYAGDANRLESAMIEAGWVERDGRNLRACKWLEKNRGLCTAWENGQRGGRPPKPDRNPRVTDGKPDGNRNGTGSKPIGLDKTGQDKTGISTLPATKGAREPIADDTPDEGSRQAGEVVDAIVLWSGSSLPRSRAYPVANDLMRIVEDHPVTPAEGPTPSPHEVTLALIATMKSQPNAPPPSERARVRQYAISVMTRCTADGKMPGEFDPIVKAEKPISEFERSRRELKDFAKSLGGSQ